MHLMRTWLLNLSDEEITQAIDSWFDREIWDQTPDKLRWIVIDLDLYEQAVHLQKCNFDRAYAQLTWKGPS
jgi:hypothetical protein